MRPTTGAAYTDGRGMFRPSEVRIDPGSEMRGRRRLKADACVIGTGAGGGPVAKELAEGGLSVVMLEEGEPVTPDELTGRPRDMVARLYRDGGQTVTRGNVPIVLPLGCAVGGTTVVNSGTCFRTPGPVLGRWGERYGLDSMTPDALDPFFRRVERELGVAQVPPELAGRNALVVKRGADALGWSGDFLHRNARGCLGSGVCAFGCPTAAKQHTGQTYVARAWDAGALTVTGARATRLLTEGGRARGVEAATAGGGRLRVDADLVVVACGAIHTPLLLGRNRLGGRSGQLGRNLAIHPATAVRAELDEDVEMARGVPQSFYVDEFAAEGLMFEGAAGPPDYLAASLPLVREELREVMLAYRRVSQFGVMVSDDSRGEVRDRARRPDIRYRLAADDVARFRRGIDLLTQLYWAAGARVVHQPVAGVPPLRDGDRGPLPGMGLRASDLTLMAFHPLGTARADARPDHGVVDGNLRMHGLEGLYVADASVVPTALGVNPQITIMALATRLAFYLLDRSPPYEEPEPETVAAVAA